MAEEIIRLLGIAPYNSMASLMGSMAGQRPDIELDVFIGDMEQGVEIAKVNLRKGYDAIISRGGTAQSIARTVPIPVIEIQLTNYDILRAIKLAENYTESYAIVGFPNITESAHVLCDLMQYRIDIVTVHNEVEVDEALAQLKAAGCRMVVCDMITQRFAKNHDLNSILITSGPESISAAYDRAAEMYHNQRRLRNENQFLKEAMRGAPAQTIILDADGEVLFSTWEGAPEELYAILRKELPRRGAQGDRKFFRNFQHVLYTVVPHQHSLNEHSYTVFNLTPSKFPINTVKRGLHFYKSAEIREIHYRSFFSITGALDRIKNDAVKFNRTTSPVILLGESGTGKKQLASFLYLKSEQNVRPLISIDCGFISEKSWQYLFHHHHSPFCDNGNTLFFMNIEHLSDERSSQLLAAILDTNLRRRNRILLSYSCRVDSELPARATEYMKRLVCLPIYLPALRDRTQEFPPICSMYLAHLNVELGKQLIGFEPKAMALLQQYQWPKNYFQLQRVLQELAVLTTTSYISSDSVANLLNRERSLNSPYSAQTPAAAPPDGSGGLTLNDVIRGAVHQAVQMHNGNQSAAARQLDISRSTLYRYLKE